MARRSSPKNFELLAEAETTPLQMGPLAGYCQGVMETLLEARRADEPGWNLPAQRFVPRRDPQPGYRRHCSAVYRR